MINEEMLINLRKMRDLRAVYKQTLQELTVAEVNNDIKIKAYNEYVESAERFEEETRRITEFIKNELEIACKEFEDFLVLENNTRDSLQNEYKNKCKHSYITSFYEDFNCIRDEIDFNNYELEKEEFELQLSLLKCLSFDYRILNTELIKYEKRQIEEDFTDFDYEDDLNYCCSSTAESISNTVCSIAHYIRRENKKIKDMKSSINQKKRQQELLEFYDRFAQLYDNEKSLDEFLSEYYKNRKIIESKHNDSLATDDSNDIDEIDF